MRIIATFAAAALLAPLAPAHAQDAGDEGSDEEYPIRSQAPCIWVEDGEEPVDVVRWIYKQEPRPDWSSGQCASITDRIGDAYYADAKRMREFDDPLGRLGFDIFVNGQDAKIDNVRIVVTPTEMKGKDDPERQVITALFDNFDRPQVIDYYWVKQGEEWALDEMVSRTPGFSWVLSTILDYGFYGHAEEDEEPEIQPSCSC